MTTLRRWTDVDDYFANLLLPPDTALESALETSAKADLPEHNVAPNPGKLLHLLARIHGARNILEIGTLGGYSTIWLARALPPGGRLVTLEAKPRYADVARANITRASLDGVVELREGPALETLPRLEEERYGPFDLFFIDADKPSNPHYLESLSISCLRNQKRPLRRGSGPVLIPPLALPRSGRRSPRARSLSAGLHPAPGGYSVIRRVYQFAWDKATTVLGDTAGL